MSNAGRQSNIELLRIVSMIFIVMSHCDEIFGLSNLYWDTIGINKIITDWLHIGGQIGVGCFLLISGYFMIEQTITAKKIFKVAGEVWFYTIGIWFLWIAMLCYKGEWQGQNILIMTRQAFFPILFGHYWFVSAYIILMILSPFLNKFINSLRKKEYDLFLTIIIIIFVVVDGGVRSFLPGIVEGRLVPVVVVYFIAGYLRRFGRFEIKNTKKHLLIAFVLYLLLFVSFYSITYIGIIKKSEEIKALCYFYRELNSPLVVAICVELFICFNKFDIKHSKFINTIAECTFGVYLIHQNIIVANRLLPTIFPIYKEEKSIYIFIYSVCSVVIIFVACTFIDLLRKYTFGRMWNTYLNGKFELHCNKIKRKVLQMWRVIKKIIYEYYNME